MIKIISI